MELGRVLEILNQRVQREQELECKIEQIRLAIESSKTRRVDYAGRKIHGLRFSLGGPIVDASVSEFVAGHVHEAVLHAMRLEELTLGLELRKARAELARERQISTAICAMVEVEE